MTSVMNSVASLQQMFQTTGIYGNRNLFCVAEYKTQTNAHARTHAHEYSSAHAVFTLHAAMYVNDVDSIVWFCDRTALYYCVPF